MIPSRRFPRPASAVVLLLAGCFATAQQPGKSPRILHPEKLTYRVEWRMLEAGEGTVELKPGPGASCHLSLDLASAGLVSRLYRVNDSYKVSTNDHFCGESTVLDAQEGKKHTVSRLNFDNTHHKVNYEERDLIKNTTTRKQLDIAPCTHEIMGALAALRTMDLEPGKTATIPITDGKKIVYAKIEAQAKESISIDGKNYSTVRCEAFLFDNVLYKRKGRLFIWMTDDSERLPVQFRLQMGFPIGNISVEMVKAEKL